MTKIEVLKQMLEADRHNASVWYLLGVEYAEQGNRSEALQAFTQALAHGDDEMKQTIIEALGKLSAAESEFIPPQAEKNRQEPAEEIAVLSVPAGPMRVIPGGKARSGAAAVKEREGVITFADVGGMHEVKEAIRMKIIQPFLSPGLFERFRKKAGGGILLYGPPGCGKTYIAKATAGECRARFVSVHIADVLDPYLGVSEQNLRDLFASARAQKPAVLFLDEMDALGYNRGKSASHTMRTVIDQLLTEMEGIDANTDKLLIIGATNMPWDVDPAFKRPGRFDKLIFVAPPDREAREAIFRLKLAERPVEPLDYRQLAEWTELYSGADIEQVVEQATENVIRDIMSTGVERPIGMEDLREAIADTRPSTIEWLRTVKNYVKYANQGGLYDDVEKFLARHKRI
ncbi:AAA family ATPase [Brevibacillus thermoruber]|uniref:AAA family ATPase n=1 Tax=Brevibacillus thermoruber TaxID=33942 RepID=UPI004042AF9B